MKKLPHDQSTFLKKTNPDWARQVHNFFLGKLQADGNDLTTQVLLDGTGQAVGKILARESGVLAGREELEIFLEKFNCKWHLRDGEHFQKNQMLLEITAPAQDLLKSERVILNFLGRMCGVATLTREFSAKLEKSVFLAATRKTLWGALDKKAVSVGGGLTHRLNLQSAILVKENHIAVLQSNWGKIRRRLERFDLENSPPDFFWEIEVESAQQFSQVLANLPQTKAPGVIMFDNFQPATISSLLQEMENPPNIFFEASGNIGPENFLAFARTGVHVLSCGFLTENAVSADLSLRLSLH